MYTTVIIMSTETMILELVKEGKRALTMTSDRAFQLWSFCPINPLKDRIEGKIDSANIWRLLYWTCLSCMIVEKFKSTSVIVFWSTHPYYLFTTENRLYFTSPWKVETASFL